MKIIFKIARAELRTLFYSPIAWFMLFLFYITCAAVFSITMEKATLLQEVLVDLDPNYIGSPGIGREIANDTLERLMRHLYLFIPLLTMGIINREINSGTIKLLYSSPVTTREIVLGKYLGLTFFNLLLLLIFGFILVSIYFSVENVEYLWYFSILLGSFLLISAYGAIGMFISCLTTYPIVAAILTFTTFFVLSVIGGLWQQFDLLRDITWFLSIEGKAAAMINGLITTRDVIYFMLVIILFIGFALIKMKGTQYPRKWTVVAVHYLSLLLVVITIGYFTSRPGYIGYADLTRSKINTIHPALQETISKLDKSPVIVTLYTNLLGEQAALGFPQYRNQYINNVWEPILRFYPNIEFRYEYYYDIREKDSSLFNKYPGKTLAQINIIEAGIANLRPSMFQSPAEIRKKIDLEPEFKRLIMQVEYKGKKEFLRTYRDNQVWPDQQNFAAVFKRLTSERQEQLTFVTGHYERDPHDFAPRNIGSKLTYKGSRSSMINLGANTDTISVTNAPVPDSIQLLVVADPRSAYTPLEQSRIRDFIRKGGNTLILAEPGKQYVLDSLVRSVGLFLGSGTVVQLSKHEMPHIFKTNLTKEGNGLADETALEYYRKYGKMGGSVTLEGAIQLNYEEIDGFKIEPVISLSGDDKTWIENGILVVDSARPVFNAAEGDLKKEAYVLGAKLTRTIRNKEQRILVIGDADFLNNRRTGGKAGNAFYSWVLNNEFPVYTNYPLALDRFITITNKQANVLQVIYLYIGSGLVLLSAIVLMVRRRRR